MKRGRTRLSICGVKASKSDVIKMVVATLVKEGWWLESVVKGWWRKVDVVVEGKGRSGERNGRKGGSRGVV